MAVVCVPSGKSDGPQAPGSFRIERTRLEEKMDRLAGNPNLRIMFLPQAIYFLLMN